MRSSMNVEDATGEPRCERFVTHVDLTEPMNVSTLTLAVNISALKTDDVCGVASKRPRVKVLQIFS